MGKTTNKDPNGQCFANAPWEFNRADLRIILKNTWQEIHTDNVPIIAAGVAFFSLLAIFPLITACLSLYGYVADAGEVQGLLNNVNSVLPDDAWQIIHAQIIAVITAPNAGLGLGIAIGLLVSL